MKKPEPSKAGNLRLSRKTQIPYRKSSEHVSGKVLYARLNSGNLRLSRKTHIPYRKSSEHVSGKVLYARHPRFLRKTHTTYRKSSDNAKAGAELSGKS